MSIVPILSTDTIVPIGRAETSVRQLKAEHDSVPVMNASDSNSPTSPPVTPPTKSSNQDTDTVKRSSLPSPPPSSRRSRAPDHHHHHHHHDQDHDQDQDQDRDQRDDLQEHEGIEKIARRLSATARPSSGAGIMTHSSSSSTSSSASHHSTIPSTLNNKHITQLKTKTLGHLTRSTSSEVDNEVANALASGRSIVSKTDWKEEDAQYLVQLIENRFPKGNIIWDWVGQQMTNRGFTKSQCRSKWKRIRTKVLHGNDPPNKDRDSRDNVREQEPDELIEDDEDELQESKHGHPRRSPPVEEDELWSDEDQAGNRPDHGMSARGHQDYTDREHSQSHHSSPRQPQHHRRQLSSSQIPDDLADDPMRSTLSIAATPTSFGKIEWKPEDSDYLVHLIESKFSSRKVDWAWVSKRMEGRGYDRTQCKSRWWRVQHRQNQSGQYGSISQPLSSRGRQPSGSDPLPRTEFDANESANDRDDKSILSDAGEADPHRKQGSSERITRSPSTSRDPGTLQRDEPRAVHSHHRYSKSKDRGEMEENPGVDDQGSSPRTARPHEHQKHIEWKEEDSQYMYRMIEREFPVGNVVWSVIGEKMASRGYSQTQCMSKWRRHLKNNKLSGENNKGSASMDMDIDVDMGGTPNPNGVHIDNGPRTTVATAAAYRRRGEDERSIYGADRGEGAKRLKTHGPDNRSHERDFSRSGAPLDPRLVEMEYDRYYDAGGKRRRAGGDGYQASDHPSRHGRTISSSSFDDYRGYVRDPSKYYPGEGEAGVTGSRHRRDYSMNEDVPAVVPNSDRDARTSRSETSYGPYGDSAPHQRRHPHASTQGPYESDYIQKDRRGEDNAMAMDEEWDEPPKSIREPRSAKRYHAQAPLSSEPHGWSEEQRRGGTRAEGSHTHTAHHHSHHQNHNHHRSSSSASVAYRDQYDQPQSYADTPGVSGRYKDSNEQSHHYARAGEPMPDPSREGRRRPHEPEPEPMREQRDRPMARSPDRGFVGNTSSARYRARPGMDREDGLAEDDYTNRGHMNRSSMDFDRDGGPRYNYRSSRYDRPTSRSYPSRRPPAEEDQDLEFIDYALEDDMDWASGRFESRDMARLAAAVARQGRRWDALRAQIRIPILMNPYEDDDIYDGMRFDPHPSTYAYSPGGSKGSSQQYSHRRRSSSLAGRHQRHVSGTTSTRYGPPPTRNGAAQITSTGPASLPVERSAHAASKSAQFERSRRVVPESTLPVLSEPVEVDLVMETPEGSGSMHTQQSVASGRVSRGAEEEAIVDVVSVDVEEGVRPDGEPTKVVHDDRLEEIEQGQDQVMAEADPVADEGEQRTEAMEREHGEVEAGPSEQQVEALDVQEGGAAVAAGAEEAARGIQTMSSA
ncbi:hypothetical protein BG011_001091 [Mortierella polycephala]|uniref:Myb-like domain-containing protein n=1 Tax=Mortierella polycephala TaxID=41804 RepID=A0A9P6TUZ1_9FUNG|nr:hypothetical protein BG011_001091 [Mortierella polycephala]